MTTGSAAAVGARGRLALDVAAAVDAVRGVRRTTSGSVEMATQYPGGKVDGVTLEDGRVTVTVIAERLPIGLLTAEIRAAAVLALAGRGGFSAVDVVFADIDNIDRLPGYSGSMR